VRILQKPLVARCLLLGFPSVAAGARCVGRVIASGVIPGGMEMMDRKTIHAVERFQPCGYPLDAGSLVIVELDGVEAEVDHLVGVVEKIARGEGATTIRASTSEAERLRFWAGRKNAFPAVNCIKPDYLCMDGTIPRARLPEVLAGMDVLAEKYGLSVANVFHAGDGNLHPLILFDANDADQLRRCELFGADILETSVAMGGTVTGEHGVGVEKLNSMCVQFSAEENEQMFGIKRAFDPQGLLNPGKVIPTLNRCAEYGKMLVRAGQIKHPDLPRF
jgi:glycolate oxidase